MPANTIPIHPITPVISFCDLTAATACATRGPTATAGLAAANIFELCPVSTNGKRIDKIQVDFASTAITSDSVAQIVGIWMWNGTTAWMIDEILVTVTDASTVLVGYHGSKTYSNLILPPTYKLFASTTVTTVANTTALTVTAFGGDY